IECRSTMQKKPSPRSCCAAYWRKPPIRLPRCLSPVGWMPEKMRMSSLFRSLDGNDLVEEVDGERTKRLGALAQAPAPPAAPGPGPGVEWVGAGEHEAARIPATRLARMAAVGSPELLIVMGAQASAEQVDEVVARLEEAGASAHVSHGRDATVIGAIGERELLATLPLEGFPGVEQVLPILKPYKLVSRELRR